MSSPVDGPLVSSVRNPQVAQVRKWIAQPQACRRDGVLLADGPRLVDEALASGLSCRVAFHAASSIERSLARIVRLQDAGARSIPVTDRVLSSLSPLGTPQGILGVFDRPAPSADTFWERCRIGHDAGAGRPASSGPLVVAHGLQDPTNLGSIARSALAAGAVGLALTSGTVDPFHHRSVRAAMGAVFRLPVLTVASSLGPLLAAARGGGFRTAGLSVRGETEIGRLEHGVRYALVLGSEGAGLTAEEESALDLRVRIPMRGAVDSLGVAAAAAIALYFLDVFLDRDSSPEA